ncbi:MAG TPA: MOSC N-terminal beta barrel domain-containing protein [Methylomirabilota bacterium]|nr:MOSC N-terminal beta barrel domain-containing protein [Methylomirabilota bacterium]
MRIQELWRYPVKSMAGERIESAEVTETGIAGDRMVLVAGPGDRIITSRTHPRLLGLRSTVGPDGEPLVNGRPWKGREVADAVRAAAGPQARLVRYDGPERFDVLPLLIGTDGAFEQLGVDHRRLRPNIVVGGVDGLAERGWPGHRLRVGAVITSVVKLRSRCVMTTYDPDTQEQDLSVLRRIASEFGGRMALDCAVLGGGRIAVGDPVELLDAEDA